MVTLAKVTLAQRAAIIQNYLTLSRFVITKRKYVNVWFRRTIRKAHVMSWFEQKKREENLKQGYIETKGLKDGHCNRQACQAPLASEPQHQSMTDHEYFSDGRLYYCSPCSYLFDKADQQFGDPKRITREDK